MPREAYIRRLAALAPFRSVTAREAALRAVRLVKRRRRRLFEALGDGRYSRPAIGDLDGTLARHLPDRPGFFVEAGAHDGYTASNTYYLERFKGWTGVLVEPIPALYRQCVRERPHAAVFNCALVREGGPSEARMVYRGPRSTLVGGEGSPGPSPSYLDWERPYEVTVPARTLSAVLDEASAGAIDLLVLDVEGHEVAALRGLDLDRHPPTLMLIEKNGAEAELQAVLGDRYEFVCEPSASDALYRRVSG